MVLQNNVLALLLIVFVLYNPHVAYSHINMLSLNYRHVNFKTLLDLYLTTVSIIRRFCHVRIPTLYGGRGLFLGRRRATD